MRVLHVDPERGWGGGEVQVMLLLRALRDAGHESCLAARPGSRLAQLATDAGIPVRRLPVRNHLDAWAALRLRRMARGVDVVHFHTARAHALAPALAGLPIRRVVTRRMDYVPRGGPYARWLYNRAVDVVIAISEGVRAALLQAGVEPARIRVVPSGVDLEACRAEAGARERLRAEWGWGANDVGVALVGVLERRKGHHLLLEAALRAAGQLRYVFCGAGSEEAALRAQARPLGARVRFLGFRTDVADVLAAADVAVLPSLHEGLGVAALEAMAAARPVIASRVGGLGEVMAGGEAGILIPPGDATALADALADLAADPALRHRLGVAGRRRVVERHAAARMAAGTLACYGSARWAHDE
jgi:glycosyltransferase involved in cell wall biosynthesis